MFFHDGSTNREGILLTVDERTVHFVCKVINWMVVWIELIIFAAMFRLIN